MKRWGHLLIAAACLLLLGGCSHLDSYLEIARERGLSEDYRAALKQWTRSDIIYSQFETQVHIGATYRSPMFNKAYLEEYARLYQLSQADLEKQEEILKGMASDFSEFLFYAYIPEKPSNDFDRRGSIWNIHLLNEKGERIEPVEVRRIDPVTPVVTGFFPYVKPYYGNAYRLRFPPLTGGWRSGPLTLVFVSVVGRVELKYPAP
jgi:hypothetical protein